jgi:hypothetical protein
MRNPFASCLSAANPTVPQVLPELSSCPGTARSLVRSWVIAVGILWRGSLAARSAPLCTDDTLIPKGAEQLPRDPLAGVTVCDVPPRPRLPIEVSSGGIPSRLAVLARAQPAVVKHHPCGPLLREACFYIERPSDEGRLLGRGRPVEDEAIPAVHADDRANAGHDRCYQD